MLDFFENHMAVLYSAVADFPWDSKDAYASFLAQTYYYVSHSTRLLALAAARFGVEDEGLHQRFLKHTTEEKSHHLLAIHDLKALGKQLTDYPELPMTAALYEPQYYKVEYQDPTALFGYIMPLEMLAVRKGRWIFGCVEKAFGTKAASFVKVHAEDDEGHVTEGLEHLRQLDPSKMNRINFNFVQTDANVLKTIAANTSAHANRTVQC
jgi:hypothetical protein